MAIDIKSNPGDQNISTVNGVKLTEDNKFKGTLIIEAYDGLIDSINEEAENQTFYALGITFNTIGALASTIEFIVNPFGQLFGMGVGWLMEHLEPLKACLDFITGDPDEIRRKSDEAKQLAAMVRVIAEDHKQQMTKVDGWTGKSKDTYDANMEQFSIELDKTADALLTESKIIAITGLIIQIGRDILRDMIAVAVGTFIADAIAAVVSGAFTFGAGTAIFASKIAIEVAAFVAKLTAKITKIGQAIAKLATLNGKLDEALKMIKTGWGRFLEPASDVLEVGFESYKQSYEIDKYIDEEKKKDDAVDADQAKVDEKSDAATKANDEYKAAKDAEAKEAEEVKKASEKVDKESTEAKAANDKAKTYADQAEKHATDAEMWAKKAEQAAKDGDEAAFDKAKANYEKAKENFDEANDKFEAAKSVAEKEHADVTGAMKDLSKETTDLSEASSKSYEEFQDTKKPLDEAEQASKDFQEKYATKEADLPPEEQAKYQETKKAADDMDAKNDTARADMEAYEKANSEYAAKNATATELQAKAMETGDEKDIAAADKASEEAKTAGDKAEQTGKQAEASGKEAEAAYKEFKKHQPPAEGLDPLGDYEEFKKNQPSQDGITIV